MITEEVKTIRDEVERRYQEQNLNAMCELYKEIKKYLPVSDESVANNILDCFSWWHIDHILSRIEEHPDWKEVFHDEIERLEQNKAYFVKIYEEQNKMEKDKLPWWKRLFGKNTKHNSTEATKEEV